MKKDALSKMTLSAVLLAVGIVLPLLTGQIKEIGDSVLPMHLPVMLCGFLCGWQYGGFIGLILPFLRSVTFGMPPIYPKAVWMALELCTYGAIIGVMYLLLKKQNVLSIYISLITAMVSGRIVWGITKAILLGLDGNAFTLSMFWTGGFVDALPGIILQLLLIPPWVSVINTTLSRYKKD